MLALNPEVSLTPAQLAAATAAMLRIAHVDGACTAEEVALIRTFYGDATPSFETLLGSYAGTPAGAAELPDPAVRDAVFATCIMVAYADGTLSPAERAALDALAAELGIAAGRGEELLGLVRDTMLSRLSKLPDAGSVAVVARELG